MDYNFTEFGVDSSSHFPFKAAWTHAHTIDGTLMNEDCEAVKTTL